MPVRNKQQSALARCLPSPLIGQGIGVFVPPGTGVSGNPLEQKLRAFLINGKRHFDEVEILNRTGLPLPAAALPTGSPLRDRLNGKAAIRVDRCRNAGRHKAGTFDEGGEFHAIVRRIGVVSVKFCSDFVFTDVDRPPTTRPRIGNRPAIREHAVQGPVGIRFQYLRRTEHSTARSLLLSPRLNHVCDGSRSAAMLKTQARRPPGIPIENRLRKGELVAADATGKAGHSGRLTGVRTVAG